MSKKVVKERNIQLDFTKTILIFLVVFGHAITYLQDGSACARALYNGIYSFHMPLFVILSGYFSKNVTTHRRKDIELLLYPYIIFQLLWVLFLNVYKSPHVSWDYNLFVPVRQNWYLLALFIWRWTLPYCQMFKKWAVLSIAIILAVYVGYFPVFNEFNSLHRIFYFFPFFLLGYYMPDIDRVQKKMGKWKYVMPAIFLLSMVCVSILSFSGKGHQILGIAYFPRVCYLTFSHLLIRMAGFASSIIIALSFLSTLQMVKINKAASWIGGGPSWYF